MLNAALAILQDEHRSLAAVLHGLKYLVDEIRGGRRQPDFRLLWSMLYYIETFPDKLHHPKESAYLFARLARRTKEADEVLRELELQHAEEPAKVRRLSEALGHYEAGAAGGLEEFAREIDAFCESGWEHMRLEERVVIPLAKKHLTPEDWVEIGQAFSENGDPRFGAAPDHEFRDLYSRIVNLAPPPLGMGDAEPRRD